jgi:uncharacterized coiled-coil protein SlyX
MALQELDKAISDSSAEYRFSLGKDVCRTTVLCLSKSLAVLEGSYKRLFPQDRRLEPIFPWANEPGQIGPALLRAFSLPTSQTLLRAGFRIIDSVNQFIFLGDLADPEFESSFEASHQEFKKRIGPIESEQTPSHTIGIFLIKNINSADGTATILPSERLKPLRKVQALLDKVIVLDIVNPQGVLIDRAEDVHCLLGHCLHWVFGMPIKYLDDGNLQGYSEWLKRGDVSYPRISAFTGRSLVLPMEWILKSIAVMKGCEVLQSVLFKPDEDPAGASPMGFINELSINSLDFLRSHLVRNPDYKFPDPLKSMPEWNFGSAREFLQRMDALDASLPENARDYRNTFIQVSEKLCVQSRLRLEEYLVRIISRTKGGILIAGVFLNHISEHLTRLSNDIPQTAEFEDPVAIREKIRAQLDKGPSRLAVILRASLLAVVIFLGFGVFKNGMIRDVLLRLIGSGAVMLLGFIYWHSWKTRLQRRVIEYKNRINKKWNVLLSNEIISTQRKTIDDLNKQIDETKKEVERVQRRTESLLRFFNTEYLPDRPEETSFWLNITMDRNAIVGRYLTRVSADPLEVANQFQSEESILESWKRMGNPEDRNPNDWEWALLERASLRILPFLEELKNVTVCQEVRDHPEIKEQFSNALRSCAGPFIRIVAGSDPITVRPTIESPRGCDDLVSEIIRSVRDSVGEPRIVESLCRYRLSYLGYADDIDLEAIRLE